MKALLVDPNFPVDRDFLTAMSVLALAQDTTEKEPALRIELETHFRRALKLALETKRGQARAVSMNTLQSRIDAVSLTTGEVRTVVPSGATARSSSP